MLKITSDGRKLGLDQRIINSHAAGRTRHKSQPVRGQYPANLAGRTAGKADPAGVLRHFHTPGGWLQKVAKTLDNPILHALEQAVPEPEKPLAFTVYEDIRQKLIAQGVCPPARSRLSMKPIPKSAKGAVLQSPLRPGARPVRLHPEDGGRDQRAGFAGGPSRSGLPLEARRSGPAKGRIERQGNQNPLVHVYRYVTEGTFDAYLWQTVENKQKFISQIMTSKSPVRSCDDVDETALSFAEIKALCAGDPRIKERMDLDVEVSRLKLMKADHQSKQYRLEDQLLKHFPEEIEKHKGFIQGLETDMKPWAAHPTRQTDLPAWKSGAIRSPTKRTPEPPFWTPARRLKAPSRCRSAATGDLLCL